MENEMPFWNGPILGDMLIFFWVGTVYVSFTRGI